GRDALAHGDGVAVDGLGDVGRGGGEGDAGGETEVARGGAGQRGGGGRGSLFASGKGGRVSHDMTSFYAVGKGRRDGQQRPGGLRSQLRVKQSRHDAGPDLLAAGFRSGPGDPALGDADGLLIVDGVLLLYRRPAGPGGAIVVAGE